MDYKYLFAISAIIIVLLLAACVILILLYRNCRAVCSNKVKTLMNQLTEKTDFFSNMTHELKTPLSVILGAIQLMDIKKVGQTEADSNLNKNVKIIKVNCYRLLRITNNLLDMAKMEAGYLKLKLVNCDLNLLLDEIVQSVMPYAVQRQLSLHYNKSAEDISTAVDIEKMERILLNLLSNAIKFTKPGGQINVSSYMFESRIRISVKDTGVGIAAENQEEVFNRFKQVDNYSSVENKGSGLGLSLVKSFVNLHQGGIKMISELGKGCEFLIDLPKNNVPEVINEFDSRDYNVQIAEAARIEFSNLHTVAS
jgi:signal transduction histidine kinase